MRKTLTALAVTAAAFTIPMLGTGTAYAADTDVDLAAFPPCTGIPITVDHYGVCVTSSGSTAIYGGGVFWTPGVPKQTVWTPAVGPVPAQAIGTPIIPSEGVTVPAITVNSPVVTPCAGQVGC